MPDKVSNSKSSSKSKPASSSGNRSESKGKDSKNSASAQKSNDNKAPPSSSSQKNNPSTSSTQNNGNSAQNTGSSSTRNNGNTGAAQNQASGGSGSTYVRNKEKQQGGTGQPVKTFNDGYDSTKSSQKVDLKGGQSNSPTQVNGQKNSHLAYAQTTPPEENTTGTTEPNATTTTEPNATTTTDPNAINTTEPNADIGSDTPITNIDPNESTITPESSQTIPESLSPDIQQDAQEMNSTILPNSGLTTGDSTLTGEQPTTTEEMPLDESTLETEPQNEDYVPYGPTDTFHEIDRTLHLVDDYTGTVNETAMNGEEQALETYTDLLKGERSKLKDLRDNSLDQLEEAEELAKQGEYVGREDEAFTLSDEQLQRLDPQNTSEAMQNVYTDYSNVQLGLNSLNQAVIDNDEAAIEDWEDKVDGYQKNFKESMKEICEFFNDDRDLAKDGELDGGSYFSGQFFEDNGLSNDVSGTSDTLTEQQQPATAEEAFQQAVLAGVQDEAAYQQENSGIIKVATADETGAFSLDTNEQGQFVNTKGEPVKALLMGGNPNKDQTGEPFLSSNSATWDGLGLANPDVGKVSFTAEGNKLTLDHNDLVSSSKMTDPTALKDYFNKVTDVSLYGREYKPNDQPLKFTELPTPMTGTQYYDKYLANDAGTLLLNDSNPKVDGAIQHWAAYVGSDIEAQLAASGIGEQSSSATTDNLTDDTGLTTGTTGDTTGTGSTLTDPDGDGVFYESGASQNPPTGQTYTLTGDAAPSTNTANAQTTPISLNESVMDVYSGDGRLPSSKNDIGDGYLRGIGAANVTMGGQPKWLDVNQLASYMAGAKQEDPNVQRAGIDNYIKQQLAGTGDITYLDRNGKLLPAEFALSKSLDGLLNDLWTSVEGDAKIPV